MSISPERLRVALSCTFFQLHAPRVRMCAHKRANPNFPQPSATPGGIQNFTISIAMTGGAHANAISPQFQGGGGHNLKGKKVPVEKQQRQIIDGIITCAGKHGFRRKWRTSRDASRPVTDPSPMPRSQATIAALSRLSRSDTAEPAP